MSRKAEIPFYDPALSYEENYEQGPFGAFADSVIWQPDGPPAYALFGLPLHVPIGIPAGPLLNAHYIKAAENKGFGICTYKTVRSRFFPSHPFPNILSLEVDKTFSIEQAAKGISEHTDFSSHPTITNSFGVPSQAPEVWQQDLHSAVQSCQPGHIIIGSFQGTTGEGEAAYVTDCVRTAEMVAATGAPIIEQNLSCPNEGDPTKLLCFDIARVEKICTSIKNALPDLPLIVKIAYFSDDKMLDEFVQRVGSIVDGISAINTIPARIVNAEGKPALPGKGREFSGVCGNAIRPYGLDMTKRLAELREYYHQTFTIIGVGGVMNSAHFHQYREAGADVVMSATGAMWNPYLAQEIYQSLRK